jgi:lipoyl(octanoyl) transferase
MGLELPVFDLGRMEYGAAYDLQLAHHAEVLASREAGSPVAGRLLLVEHDPPVITISRRPDARRHLTATPLQLSLHGVTVAETDRGGDITYHGPGQLVAYPILDLNFLRLPLHDYLRLLEAVVIDVVASYGIGAYRDPAATGVWIRPNEPASSSAKICAMGVRIRRWVTMHGLALNVTTDLSHFDLIVPCGLVGRSVTSLQRELAASGHASPGMADVKARLTRTLTHHLEHHLSAGETDKDGG